MAFYITLDQEKRTRQTDVDRRAVVGFGAKSWPSSRQMQRPWGSHLQAPSRCPRR